MSGNPPVTTRHRVALLATQIVESFIRASFDDESILLNQQRRNIQDPYGILLERREEAGNSQFSIPTLDPTTLIDAL